MHLEANRPPPEVVQQVQEEIARLMVANAHALAASCAESCVHQAWVSFLGRLEPQAEQPASIAGEPATSEGNGQASDGNGCAEADVGAEERQLCVQVGSRTTQEQSRTSLEGDAAEPIPEVSRVTSISGADNNWATPDEALPLALTRPPKISGLQRSCGGQAAVAAPLLAGMPPELAASAVTRAESSVVSEVSERIPGSRARVRMCSSPVRYKASRESEWWSIHDQSPTSSPKGQDHRQTPPGNQPRTVHFCLPETSLEPAADARAVAADESDAASSVQAASAFTLNALYGRVAAAQDAAAPVQPHDEVQPANVESAASTTATVLSESVSPTLVCAQGEQMSQADCAVPETIAAKEHMAVDVAAISHEKDPTCAKAAYVRNAAAEEYRAEVDEESAASASSHAVHSEMSNAVAEAPLPRSPVEDVGDHRRELLSPETRQEAPSEIASSLLVRPSLPLHGLASAPLPPPSEQEPALPPTPTNSPAVISVGNPSQVLASQLSSQAEAENQQAAELDVVRNCLSTSAPSPASSLFSPTQHVTAPAATPEQISRSDAGDGQQDATPGGDDPGDACDFDAELEALRHSVAAIAGQLACLGMEANAAAASAAALGVLPPEGCQSLPDALVPAGVGGSSAAVAAAAISAAPNNATVLAATSDVDSFEGELAGEKRAFQDFLNGAVAAAACLLDKRDHYRRMSSQLNDTGGAGAVAAAVELSFNEH